MKTNLELNRGLWVVTGGYRRLPGGSDDFSLQTDKQTLHHNIYITTVTGIGIIAIEIFTCEFWTWPATWAQIKTFGGPGGTKNMSLLKTRLKECDLRCNVIAEKIRHLFTFIAWPSFLRNCNWVQVSPPFVFVSTKIPRDTTNPVFLPERQCNEFNITWNWNVQCLVQRY